MNQVDSTSSHSTWQALPSHEQNLLQWVEWIECYWRKINPRTWDLHTLSQVCLTLSVSLCLFSCIRWNCKLHSQLTALNAKYTQQERGRGKKKRDSWRDEMQVKVVSIFHSLAKFSSQEKRNTKSPVRFIKQDSSVNKSLSLSKLVLSQGASLFLVSNSLSLYPFSPSLGWLLSQFFSISSSWLCLFLSFFLFLSSLHLSSVQCSRLVSHFFARWS